MKRLVFVLLPLLALSASAQSLDVRIDTGEADAVLAILAKRRAKVPVTETDFDPLFATRGYVRLKQRETALQRPFDEPSMIAFVMSDDLASREDALRRTVDSWRRIDISQAASRALRYLPRGTTLRATIYPVIKPRDNSFVFDILGDPAIFMYVREEPKEKLENTIAHELHHIGLAAACKAAPQQKVHWVSAFGEGIAMLAAAGGPNVHPHAVSPAADRERWDRDVARAEQDLRTVEKFLLDVANGRLDEDAARARAMEFFGVQGPWYTVGWVMASTIEKELGRKALIDSMCDGRKLLATYNRAAAGKALPRWSDELLRALE